MSERNSVSAETIGISIGFGAETFFSETETFFFQKFSKDHHFCHPFFLLLSISSKSIIAAMLQSKLHRQQQKLQDNEATRSCLQPKKASHFLDFF